MLLVLISVPTIRPHRGEGDKNEPYTDPGDHHADHAQPGNEGRPAGLRRLSGHQAPLLLVVGRGVTAQF